MRKLLWFRHLTKKSTSKKNDISNVQPVSILTTFSKIYKSVTKKMINQAMNKYFLYFYFCLLTKLEDPACFDSFTRKIEGRPG